MLYNMSSRIIFTKIRAEENMKSSTIHKSNLSRERITILEELLSEKQKEYENSADELGKLSKERELDILWQGLKSHKEERSPGVYLSIGFVTGALCMFLMTSILNFGHNSENVTDLNLWKKSSINAEKVAPIGVDPASTVLGAAAPVKFEAYKIKSGDTLEKISIKYYGTSSKLKNIQEANKIKNPHSIQMGQVIKVPIYE